MRSCSSIAAARFAAAAAAVFAAFVAQATIASAQRPESPTTEFDYALRTRKIGDPCVSGADCGYPGAACAGGMCQCVPHLPVTNHINKCGRRASVNESCFFNEQCESMNIATECHSGRCECLYELVAVPTPDGGVDCIARDEPPPSLQYVDPAMIGVLVGMALMFVIICVVLRLFSRARWRENRTIFNTPNPRLMNVSLLRDNKLLHAQDRRGSRASMRAPSRQQSQQELHAGSAHGSRRGSGASGGSRGSPAARPMLDGVTVEAPRRA